MNLYRINYSNKDTGGHEVYALAKSIEDLINEPDPNKNPNDIIIKIEALSHGFAGFKATYYN
ncbi:MAG: hypothetical protein Q7R56_01745 [Nanoarchaeota archaeon]|nr:hypothetical protein [Nanoarchaeota archaeon]